MHRVQICLQESLHESLKLHARSGGISVSELIRRMLEAHIDTNPAADARAHFDTLEPLESFADVDATDYVKSLRSKSRILRSNDALRRGTE